MAAIDGNLPGSDLIATGLADLASGATSESSLLVEMAAPRLRRLGVDVPPTEPNAGHRLYELLSAEHQDAHSRYLAGIRRVASFASAAEHASSR